MHSTSYIYQLLISMLKKTIRTSLTEIKNKNCIDRTKNVLKFRMCYFSLSLYEIASTFPLSLSRSSLIQRYISHRESKSESSGSSTIYLIAFAGLKIRNPLEPTSSFSFDAVAFIILFFLSVSRFVFLRWNPSNQRHKKTLNHH